MKDIDMSLVYDLSETQHADKLLLSIYTIFLEIILTLIVPINTLYLSNEF